jgi:hypothetical protein
MKNNYSTDDRRGGYYWVDKEPYVSVTNVLKVIDKSGALMRWFGKAVYLEMVKDPTLSESDALGAPYKLRDKATERGKVVHSIVEAWETTGLEIKTIPDIYKPYAESFYKWIKDNDIELKEHEKTVVSKSHKYAGTLDLIVKKSGDQLWIIDIKTGKDIYKEDSGMKIDRMGVVLLQESGKYKFEEVEDCFDAFLACQQLWCFLNKEDNKKVGYKL